MSMQSAITSVAILALMQIVLGLAVSGCRWKFKRSTGIPDDPGHPMKRVVTAYSNCAEWHPLFYALLLVQAINGGPKWVVWMGPAVVAGRCLLVAGLLTFTLRKPNVFRFLGAAITYLTALILVGLLLFV